MDRCLYMEIFTIKERVSFDFMLRDSINFMLNMNILDIKYENSCIFSDLFCSKNQSYCKDKYCNRMTYK